MKTETTVSDPEKSKARRTLLGVLAYLGFILLLGSAVVGYAWYVKHDVGFGTSVECYVTNVPIGTRDYQVVADTKGYFWVCIKEPRRVGCFPMASFNTSQECHEVGFVPVE